MKLTKDQEQMLTKMAFANKSNKDIVEELGIELKDVHAARSRLGITIDKVRVAKIAVENAQPAKRTAEEITKEISKVEKAKDAAEKKIDRCMERLEVLYSELVSAYDDNN